MWGFAYFFGAGIVAWFLALRGWAGVRRIETLDEAEFDRLRAGALGQSGLPGQKSGSRFFRPGVAVLRVLIWGSSAALLAFAVFEAMRGLLAREFDVFVVWALLLTCLLTPFVVWVVSFAERHERITKRAERAVGISSDSRQ